MNETNTQACHGCGLPISKTCSIDCYKKPAPAPAAPSSLAPAITEQSLKLFLAYARDAGNWSGTPCIGGNVGGAKEERGNITQLKKAGLITTFASDGSSFVQFTPAGRALATQHGIEIDS